MQQSSYGINSSVAVAAVDDALPWQHSSVRHHRRFVLLCDLADNKRQFSNMLSDKIIAFEHSFCVFMCFRASKRVHGKFSLIDLAGA